MSLSESTASQEANRRKLTGMLVRPQDQVKFMFVFVGGVLLSLAATVGLLAAHLSSAIQFLEETQRLDPESATILRDTLHTSLYVICAVASLVAIFSTAMGLRLSHRIFGPMVPIHRFICKLIEGQIPERLKLRDKDELREIADALNTLADKMERDRR